jgi:hypothetical protein
MNAPFYDYVGKCYVFGFTVGVPHRTLVLRENLPASGQLVAEGACIVIFSTLSRLR